MKTPNGYPEPSQFYALAHLVMQLLSEADSVFFGEQLYNEYSLSRNIF